MLHLSATWVRFSCIINLVKCYRVNGAVFQSGLVHRMSETELEISVRLLHSASYRL